MAGSSERKDDAPVNSDLGYYRVLEGDCVGSIAYEHGFFWKTIWDHPNNRLLKEKRKNPNTLRPGDGVFIPELTVREENRATDNRHQFKKKGVPAHFYLRLMYQHKARTNVEYKLIVAGKTFTGRTNSDGELHHPIPPNAKEAILKVKDGKRWEQTTLMLGALRPSTHLEGARDRLTNLGYDAGTADDADANAALKSALARFNEDEKLNSSANLEETLKHLESLHDGARAHRAAGGNNQGREKWKIHPDTDCPGETMYEPLTEEDFAFSSEEDGALPDDTDSN